MTPIKSLPYSTHVLSYHRKQAKHEHESMRAHINYTLSIALCSPEYASQLHRENNLLLRDTLSSIILSQK